MNDESLFEGGFTPQSWEHAKSFANILGNLPSSFTSVIRLLMTDYDRNPEGLTTYSRFFLGRLLKSPSIRIPYYFATKFLRPKLLQDSTEQFELRDLMNAFGGYEHAALLSSIFLYKFSRKLCDPVLLDPVVHRLQLNLNLGWCVGHAIPAVGAGAGLLLGGFRLYGFIPFIKHDPAGAQEYASYLRDSGMRVDLEYEFKRWQCNSLQVAVMLCQQLGFGIKRAVPLMRAITTTSPLLTQDELERAFRVVDVWMESLEHNRSSPAIPLPPKYYPNKASLDELILQVEKALQPGDSNWITKSREDATPETAPHLFMGNSDMFDFESAEVPTEMAEALPDETINELSNKLLKDFLAEDS